MSSFKDRFEGTTILERIPTLRWARELVTLRLAEHFKNIDSSAPYPTWPVRPEAFAEAQFYTPRKRPQGTHRAHQTCVARGEIKELMRLNEQRPPGRADQRDPDDAQRNPRDRDEVRPPRGRRPRHRARWTPCRRTPSCPAFWRPVFEAWAVEKGDDETAYKVDPTFGSAHLLHARLRQVLDEAQGRRDPLGDPRHQRQAPERGADPAPRGPSSRPGLEAETPKRRLDHHQEHPRGHSWAEDQAGPGRLPRARWPGGEGRRGTT